jgi:hypothetical protein
MLAKVTEEQRERGCLKISEARSVGGMGCPGNRMFVEIQARRGGSVYLVQSPCPAVWEPTVSTFKKNFQGPVNANEMIQNGESLGRARQAFCRGSIGRWVVVTGTGATSRLINENRGRRAVRINVWK